MDIQKYILHQFEQNIKNEGTFWRIARLDTFVDLLMMQAGKASESGSIDDKLAMDVILIAIKALVNGKLGIKDYSKEYKKMNRELFEELDLVHAEVDRIVQDALSKSQENLSGLSLSDDLIYFEVLNKLNIENYSLGLFENILETFIGFIKSNN